VVPPSKIVDAFLEAKPELMAKAHAGPEDLQPVPDAPVSRPPEEPSSQPPLKIAVPVPAAVAKEQEAASRATLPGTAPDPASAEAKEQEAASRATLPGTAPDPASVKAKEEAVPPVPDIVPPTPIDPLVPPVPATAAPAVIPGLKELTGQDPPAPAAESKQEEPPEPEEPASLKVELPSPPLPPSPSPPPSSSGNETEAVRATAELLKPVSVPAPIAPTASYAGIALKKSPSPVFRILESRLAIFVLGALAGGLVVGPLTCLIGSGGDQTPQTAAVPVTPPAPHRTERPEPVPVPVPAPTPASAPELAPKAEEAGKPAPAVEPAKPRVRLSRAKVRQLHRYLRLSRKAMKRRRYRRALSWASKALRLRPDDQRAARLRARARRKLGR
jgi:hypothetical protein